MEISALAPMSRNKVYFLPEPKIIMFTILPSSRNDFMFVSIEVLCVRAKAE